MKWQRFRIVVILVMLLHAWIGWRLLAPFSPGTTGIVLTALGLLASSLLMPYSLVSRFLKPGFSVPVLVWTGLVCMGFFSSVLVLTLVREALLGLALMVDSLRGTTLHDSLTHPTAIAVIAGATLVTLAGYLNARARAAVVDVRVPMATLDPALEGFRIVQISDVHIGPTIKGDYVSRIVDAINALDADAIVITGDLVDGHVEVLAPHAAPLRELKSRHGSFFVTGNHEYYSGAHGWIEHLPTLGITVLLNEHRTLNHDGATLVLAGITDFSAHHFDATHRSDPQRAIANAPPEAPRILLAHQPRSADAAEAAGIDLQISGHTHGGQFLPWNLFVPLQQPFVAGLHKHGRMWIYTSRGTGYWGPPKRFGAPSEITLLTLTRA